MDIVNHCEPIVAVVSQVLTERRLFLFPLAVTVD